MNKIWGISGALLVCAFLLTPMTSEGPSEVAFALHRADLALFGLAVAIWGVLVPDRRRGKRSLFRKMFVRGIGIRLALIALGNALLSSGAALGSRHYWDYAMTGFSFHLLGPARMMAEQSLVLSAFGLTCTSEILNHLLCEGGLGPIGVIYLFSSVDALVLALLGMAGERGLAPFQVFQVVSRIGFTTALFSVPLAIYGGRIGYWGAEPFAWFFSALALALLPSLARKRVR